MKKALITVRLSLGGAVCGVFAGVVGGAVVGIVCGAFLGDVSFGVEGALVGGCSLALGGALYGVVLGLTSEQDPQQEMAVSIGSSDHQSRLHRQMVPLPGPGPGGTPENKHLPLLDRGHPTNGAVSEASWVG